MPHGSVVYPCIHGAENIVSIKAAVVVANDLVVKRGVNEIDGLICLDEETNKGSRGMALQYLGMSKLLV